MIFRALNVLAVIVLLIAPSAAQDRVRVGTLRAISSGALFLADARGYFKAEGVTVDLIAFTSPQTAVEALAAGRTDITIADFTAVAFKLASEGKFKAIAAQVREKSGHEGNEVVASYAASDTGLRRLENLAGRSVGITQAGSPYHYQLGQIMRLKGIKQNTLTMKPLQTIEAVARAVITGEVDAVILPSLYARELLVSNQARLVGWYSELDEQQLGAVFASTEMLTERRATTEKFVRAYLRGVTDYATALLRNDRFGKRMSDPRSQEAGATIARYVFPGKPLVDSTLLVEAGSYYMERNGKLDLADIEKQLEWYRAQGFVDGKATTRSVVDPSFIR